MQTGFSCVFILQCCWLHWNLWSFYTRLPLHVAWAFVRERRQYWGYKRTSASPEHGTNIIVIETFIAKPPAAGEILARAAIEDLAEGIKAGKEQIWVYSGMECKPPFWQIWNAPRHVLSRWLESTMSTYGGGVMHKSHCCHVYTVKRGRLLASPVKISSVL